MYTVTKERLQKLYECEWKLGNIRFYKPQNFFVVDQEIHIYFVIKYQACG